MEVPGRAGSIGEHCGLGGGAVEVVDEALELVVGEVHGLPATLLGGSIVTIAANRGSTAGTMDVGLVVLRPLRRLRRGGTASYGFVGSIIGFDHLYRLQ